MIVTALLLLAGSRQLPPTLHVHEEDGFEWAADLVPGPQRIVLPTLTASDRVPRAVVDARGVTLQLATPPHLSLELRTLEVRVHEHGLEEELLETAGELILVSSPTLPASLRGPQLDHLPDLARLDGQGASERELAVPAGPGGSQLVLQAGELSTGRPCMVEARPASGGSWTEHRLPTSPRSALLLDGASAWELRVPGATLDRVVHAMTRPLAGAGTRVDPRRIRRHEVDAHGLAPRRGRGPAHATHEVGPLLESPEAGTPLRLGPSQLLELELPVRLPEDDQRSVTLVVELDLELTEVEPAASALPPTPAPSWFDEAPRDILPAGVHLEGPHLQVDIRPTMGPGAAWGDVNGDGRPDLYLVQGGGREGSASPRNQLLLALPDGSFELAAEAGVDDAGAGMGALFFDLEGDGDLDLYVANYGPDRLYRNDGELRFTEVSSEHALGGDGWSAGVAAADFDRDGDLDLYVTTYLVYDLEAVPPPEELGGYQREDPVEMLPFAFPGGANHLLENRDGRLVDRTAELGLEDAEGRGMQPLWWDFDLDGDLDLYVANDVSMNVLFRNEGVGTFTDVSFLVGLDDPRGGMGVDVGDIDLDGDLDLFLTNWELEANALYRNNLITAGRRKSHTGSFQDVTVRARLGDSVGLTSWGCVLFDMDNDGDLDLFVPNGYTSPDYESTGLCIGQPDRLYRNDGTGRYEDVSELAGAGVTTPHASRCAALADFDRDGGLDLLVTNNNGPYRLLRNRVPGRGHWLGLVLRGSDGNTQAIGARIVLEAGGRSQTRVVGAGGGYLAGHAAEAHFGLGEVDSVERLEIHWPSGRTTTHEVGAIDRWSVIEEPAP